MSCLLEPIVDEEELEDLIIKYYPLVVHHAIDLVDQRRMQRAKPWIKMAHEFFEAAHKIREKRFGSDPDF